MRTPVASGRGARYINPDSLWQADEAPAEQQVALLLSDAGNQPARQGREVLSEERVALLASRKCRKDADATPVRLSLRLCRGAGRGGSKGSKSDQSRYQKDPETSHIPTSLSGDTGALCPAT